MNISISNPIPSYSLKQKKPKTEKKAPCLSKFNIFSILIFKRQWL